MKRSQSPESNQIPENRNGTRSYRAYLKFTLGGNVTGLSALAFASQRQWAKARKHVEAGHRACEVQGRVMRALVRESWAMFGDHLESASYF